MTTYFFGLHTNVSIDLKVMNKFQKVVSIELN